MYRNFSYARTFTNVEPMALTPNSTSKKMSDRSVWAARVRQRAIGKQLRDSYSTFVSEPIPEEFIALLMQIDQVAVERAHLPKGDK